MAPNAPTRRQFREALGWSQTALRIHIDRLCEMEYVKVHRGGRGSTMVYELLWDGRGREGEPTLCGLIDVNKLDSQPAASTKDKDESSTTTDNLAQPETNLAGESDQLAGSKQAESADLAQAKKNGKPKSSKE